MENTYLPVKSGFFYLLLLTILLTGQNLYAEQNVIHRNNWYESQPDDSATIQMSGHETEEEALAYIESAGLTGDVGYYQTTYKGKPWFAVTYGLFSSLDQARSELESLPDNLQRHAPWPRTFKAINALIEVADKTAQSNTEDASALAADTDTSDWEKGQSAYDQGDYKKAFKIWRKQAKEGDELSQFNLGVMYSRGQGTRRNNKKAIKWYMQSAEQGYAPAQFNLGASYLEGTPDAASQQKAVAWWQLAAEQGFVQAQFNIASLYCQGIGVTKDLKQCKFWYRRAASNGDTHARKMLDHLKNEEQATATNSNDKTANTSKPATQSQALAKEVSAPSTAQPSLADAAQKSLDEEKKTSTDIVTPEVRRISSRERKKLSKAQAAFTRSKYMKAHDLWVPLAESGIAEAQYSLGFLYQSGWGPERDLKKSVAWYTSAAEQNEARAQFNLGVMLLNGDEGIEKDLETGLLWLTRSAENNNTRAKEFLSSMYSKGEYGVEKSMEKANYWKSR